MNLLFCVGCDHYDSLVSLAGAEADANLVFEILTAPEGIYDPVGSRLLLSPNLADIRDALKEVFPFRADYDAVTFFFAGHGAVNAGGFYLCARDSKGDQLSTTALSIEHVFSIIANFQPPQVNIIVDACEAGGSSFDLGRLIRPEIIGSSTSSSVAFLGACGEDQYALEEDGHGFLTAELVRCLKGTTEVQTRAPFIDLVEVGQIVSPLVHERNPDQRPLSWGLSLFGGSRFALNPLYGKDRQHFPLPTLSAASVIGRQVREHSSDLWKFYRSMPDEFDPRGLLDILEKLFPSHADDPRDLLSVLDGLSSTLSHRAEDLPDLLAPSCCSSTILVFLLPYIDDASVRSFLTDALERLLDRNRVLQDVLLAGICREDNSLLSANGAAADLYYLPLRITRLLGWLGSNIIIAKILPGFSFNTATAYELVQELLGRYGRSFAAVTEGQAAPLHVFFHACRLMGWRDIATEILNEYFGSYCERQGNVTRVGTGPINTVNYILSLTESEYSPTDWRSANPCNLLPILLLWGHRLEISDSWHLKHLDGRSTNFFLPTDYREFGAKIIENGHNHLLQIGFGVWTVDEFVEKFEQALASSAVDGAFNLPQEGVALSLISSLTFPDRVAFLLDGIKLR